MKLYSFDIDETLEISNGPVKLQSLVELKQQGHIVGLCGNWGLFTRVVQNWHSVISFMNVVPEYWTNGRRADKSDFLSLLKTYVPADEYIHVGNIQGEKNMLGFVCHSNDSEPANAAGFRFIKEDDFAKGVR